MTTTQSSLTALQLAEDLDRVFVKGCSEAASLLRIQYAEIERLKKQNAAYKGLTKAQEEQLSYYRTKADAYREAIATLDSEREANERLTKERDTLCAFATKVMNYWPETDIDCDELQEIALEHGLLEPETHTEPCGGYCSCAEYYNAADWDYGVICYKKTALIKGITNETL